MYRPPNQEERDNGWQGEAQALEVDESMARLEE